MVDTNSDPRQVDFMIPSNDDASKSINKVLFSDLCNSRRISFEEKSEKAEKEAENVAQTEAEDVPTLLLKLKLQEKNKITFTSAKISRLGSFL